MARIVGIKPISFTSDKTNELVSGTKLFLTEPIPPGKGFGVSTDDLYLSSSRLAELSFQPSVGMEISVNYNKKGSLVSVALVDEVLDLGDD